MSSSSLSSKAKDEDVKVKVKVLRAEMSKISYHGWQP